METRTDILEAEVKTVAKQAAVQELQLSDIQWKLEEAENRQRRNSLRIMSIKEGLEGQDTRAYIVSLFKKAIPHFVGRDTESTSVSTVFLKTRSRALIMGRNILGPSFYTLVTSCFIKLC
ncbi:hypothetical protein NDU88_000710 [Pleurodeles waltl]|uniref:Uncharacterized protein n=1 Tax=Pleurodeles waltl TaxID=8319 RepID=A0AAV7VYZ4_PLEWA|nr:hypothetical protein NDU88_000710 [Pleurodeles waltl]